VIQKIIKPREGYERLATRLTYQVIEKIIAPLIKKIWVEEIEGLENILEEGPLIVASNHESYFDFLCLTAISPRKIHYLTAEKFFKSKFWKPIMELTEQIRVDRLNPEKTQVYQRVYSLLQQNRVIGVFPEGTRSPDGHFLRPYTGVAKFALTTKVPVIPVGIVGTYEILSRYDTFPKFRKAKIHIGKPMFFHEYYDIKHTNEHFEIVTHKIMMEIAKLAGKDYPYFKG